MPKDKLLARELRGAARGSINFTVEKLYDHITEHALKPAADRGKTKVKIHLLSRKNLDNTKSVQECDHEVRGLSYDKKVLKKLIKTLESKGVRAKYKHVYKLDDAQNMVDDDYILICKWDKNICIIS